MYVYIQSERTLWTVGFYDPNGKWHSDSDHSDREEAAKRVHYLNGGQETVVIRKLNDADIEKPEFEFGEFDDGKHWRGEF